MHTPTGDIDIDRLAHVVAELHVRDSAVAQRSWGFMDVVRNAKSVDVELGKVKATLLRALHATDVELIKLPKLGDNPTQNHRLSFDDDGFISVLFRDVTRAVFNSLEKLCEQSFYVSGAQGIGKSHALYTCVCLFRLSRPAKIRVTYVQSCTSWAVHHHDEEYLFILNELCQTFQDDNISSKKGYETIAEWAQYVMEAKSAHREDRFKDLKGVLNAFVQSQGIRWISIFDQENGLYSHAHPISRIYPFNNIEGFSHQVGLASFLPSCTFFLP
jgi:hypothetical protein